MKQDKYIDSNQFATIAVNLLHRGILEADRTTAKRIFRELEEGRTVGLTNLKMEDGGMLRWDLTLDARAFQGSLNFSAWRDGVLALVARMSDELREGKSLTVFHPLDAEDQLPDDMVGHKLFGTMGITVHDGTVNTLLLGARPDPEKPIVTLQLVYVDPAQFATSESSATSSTS